MRASFRSLRLFLLGALALAGALLFSACGTIGSTDAVNAAATTTTPAVDWTPKAGLPFREPVQLHASNGRLKVRLEAKRGSIEVSGAPVVATPFNGRLVGPTLHVKPGDTIETLLVNATDQDTNIHFHGLHVSPKGIGDNVFRTFRPGTTVKSQVTLPRDHPPGTYWYHVHLHGLTEGQVMGGLSGLLIVEDLKQLLPRRLRGIKERQLAIRDLQTTGGVVDDAEQIDPQGPTQRLVNGLLRPKLSLRSGETQLWRIGNIGSDLFYNVALEGHTLQVIAEDGSPVWNVHPASHLVLPPGKRYDVLVTGGRPGSYQFKTLRYDEGFEAQPRVELASVTVTGPRATGAAAHPAIPRRLRTPSTPLGKRPIARKRTFVFSFGTGRTFEALINGRQFNPDVNNAVPILNTVEQWTLVNKSNEDHPFHIHVNDFQVVSVNGKPFHANGLQDVVVIPKNGGRVVILNPFDDFPGHFVFHCHILGHEDAGMMQTVDVIRRGARPTPPPGGGMAHMHDK
ncbi:multicopper oxidase family protein [Conexibacter sp. JD483]|uniref:multicopper oxidase family protein n=1 Tax=unclassified Conexibacter TaxID=2627773 RepID=UPI00271D3C9E|nr:MULTISPECIES: multicopper oxidase family protein [unclassified Conexibacter]MDO8185508.1 multicopper oxidase family protein [Conexibacter sp. CPCC 205706]MDO8197305.1 multicopper oxidase family protein [Conexibacter sp. CPCC 205762]MDR9370195.1 multicopper oxidase family protein [Conexibacter sp. JD483]